MEISIRPFEQRDSAAVLQLNAESVAVLSPMDGPRLQQLHGMARLHLVAEGAAGVVGFLLAFADGAAYDSANYQWFASRLRRFIYIDRVVISPAQRGGGLGRAFYQQVEGYARAHDLAWMACEVDVEPPNLASLAFHQRLGFAEVGRQSAGAGKQVAMHLRGVG